MDTSPQGTWTKGFSTALLSEVRVGVSGSGVRIKEPRSFKVQDCSIGEKLDKEIPRTWCRAWRFGLWPYKGLIASSEKQMTAPDEPRLLVLTVSFFDSKL